MQSGSFPQVDKLRTFIDYYAGYVHDDFRVNRSLTLNLGLRYEYESGLAERDNKLTVGFSRTVPNPIGQAAGVETKGGLLYAGVGGNKTTQGSPNYEDFWERRRDHAAA